MLGFDRKSSRMEAEDPLKPLAFFKVEVFYLEQIQVFFEYSFFLIFTISLSL